MLRHGQDHLLRPRSAQDSTFCTANQRGTSSFPSPSSFVSTILPKASDKSQLLREVIGEHTCDRRSTRTYIHSEFPNYPFEEKFAENDELWKPDVRESASEHTIREHEALEQIFDVDDSTFISITSHSGSIAATLRAIGHRAFALPTGGTMPVFVKVEKR